MNLKRFAVTAAFTLTCFSVPVLQAGAATPVDGGDLPPVSDVGTGAGKPEGVGKPEDAGKPEGVGKPEDAGKPEGVGKPEDAGKPEGVGKPEDAGAGRPDFTKGTLGEQVKELKAQFRQQQKELLQKYQELMKAARDASAEERAKLRLQLRDELKTKVEELIAKQKELRTELKERFAEHQELIDAAKEKAKERIRERRGNGGE